MKLTRCKDGHYYDADRYEVCPICGNVPVPPVPPVPPMPYPPNFAVDPYPPNFAFDPDPVRVCAETVESIEGCITKTSVSSVQIFPNGALVRRKGTFVLSKGLNKIYIAALTPSADRDSMRLYFPDQIRGKNVWILDEMPKDSSAGQVQAQIDLQTEKLLLIMRKYKSVKEQIKALKKYRRHMSESDFPIETVLGFLDDIPTKLAALYREKDETELQKTAAEEELMKLRDSGSGFQYGAPCVVVEIDAEEDKEISFEVEYLEKRASWIPFYEIIADTRLNTVTFLLKASVSQNSGQDWQQAGIVLNSGMIHRNRQLPEIKPLYVALAKNRRELVDDRPRMHFPAPMSSYEKDDDVDTGIFISSGSVHTDTEMYAPAPAPDHLKRLETESAQVTATETALEYTPEGLWDLSGNGSKCIIDIQSFTAGADLKYYVYPGIDSSGYLIAGIEQKPPQLLLSGRASTYLAEQFTGYTTIDTEKTTTPFEVFLGTDSRITVSRAVKEKFVSGSYIIGPGKLTKVSNSIEIKIRNSRSEAAEIVVTDRIPTSQDKAVRVAPVDLSGGSLNEETGVVTWNVGLAPDTEKVFMLKYDITYPKDEQIVTL